jgi:hypothetical protein
VSQQVEFIDLDEAWADLRRQGVVKVVDSPKELRLELDGDAAVVMDIATEDHPEVGDLPATIRRVPRGVVAMELFGISDASCFEVMRLIFQ